MDTRVGRGTAGPQSDPATWGGIDWARAFLIRSFEQRLLQLFSEGKVFGTVHTCIGQEFAGIALAAHLQPGDVTFSNHRGHGHYLAQTGDVVGLMAEILGRETGLCGGRGGSQHLCANGFFSNGVQGGGVPISAGVALARKLRGTANIATCFIGDGTLGEGVLYETLNIVSRWCVPLLVVLENNLYAQSTAQADTLAGDIALRAQAFGIGTLHGHTWAPDALKLLMGSAVRTVREESRPLFVQVDTFRLAAHSKGDDNRPREEIERYLALDPLTRFAADSPAEAELLHGIAEGLVSEAVRRALAAPVARCASFEAADVRLPPVWRKPTATVRERIVTRIYRALHDIMTEDERVILLGEDIEAPYGGAFKVTRDLSVLFPGRVRNMPISEAAMVGMANGLALAGERPICEIMFGDFLTLAADQIINHAAKFAWMYNGQVTMPVVIRSPMGGMRGYGATHSQSLEKHFLGLPGTRVLALHKHHDPYLVYRRLLESIDCPTLIIENKLLYGQYLGDATIDGFWCEETSEDFPVTRLRSAEAPDLTLFCYGGMVTDVERATDRLFEEHEIVAEVICPIQIYPLNLPPVLESVRKSGILIVVEEGQGFCGLGSELIAALHEADPGLRMTARRHGAQPHPLPSCKQAELESLPSVDSIVRLCSEVVRDVRAR